MLTDRIKKLEEEVRAKRAKNGYKRHPQSFDGYTKEYFDVKGQMDRYQRIVDSGICLTEEQMDRLESYNRRRGKNG